MSGIRIAHPDPRFRGALLRIPHPTRATATGPKTYELRLDGEGAVIVSETVWARICECWIPDAAGVKVPASSIFAVINVVDDPPHQLIGAGRDVELVTFDLTHNDDLDAPVTRASLTHKDR